MGVGVGDIAGQVMAKLATLSRASGGPFARVAWVRGAVPTPSDVAQETAGSSPSALLCFEREAPSRSLVEVLGTDTGASLVSYWVVAVALADPRSSTLALTGSVGLVGLFELQDTVRRALSGLVLYEQVATIRVLVEGTPSSVVSLGESVLSLTSGATYRPSVASVSLDGTGFGTFEAKSITPGVGGDVALGTELSWDSLPSGLLGAPLVDAIVTGSIPGAQSRSKLIYEGARHGSDERTAVAYLQFSASYEADSEERGEGTPNEHFVQLEQFDFGLEVPDGQPPYDEQPLVEGRVENMHS